MKDISYENLELQHNANNKRLIFHLTIVLQFSD